MKLQRFNNYKPLNEDHLTESSDKISYIVDTMCVIGSDYSNELVAFLSEELSDECIDELYLAIENAEEFTEKKDLFSIGKHFKVTD